MCGWTATGLVVILTRQGARKTFSLVGLRRNMLNRGSQIPQWPDRLHRIVYRQHVEVRSSTQWQNHEKIILEIWTRWGISLEQLLKSVEQMIRRFK